MSDVRLCIHRAADTIGGNCIEVMAPGGERILLDAGRPLDTPDVLQQFAEAMGPKMLVPVHGENWNRQGGSFSNMVALDKGDWSRVTCEKFVEAIMQILTQVASPHAYENS